MEIPARLTPLMDKYAVSASALCVVHCLFLPLMLSLFPALGTSMFGQELFHQLLLILVIPLSLVSLTLGCRQHQSWFVGLSGFFGIVVLVVVALLGHDGLGEFAERVATVIGASAIATAHVQNFRLCRRSHDC